MKGKSNFFTDTVSIISPTLLIQGGKINKYTDDDYTAKFRVTLKKGFSNGSYTLNITSYGGYMCGVSITKMNNSSFEFNAGEGGYGYPQYAFWYACGY